MIHELHTARHLAAPCLTCGEIAEPEVHQTRSGFYCATCCPHCKPAEHYTGAAMETIAGEQTELFERKV